LYKIINCLISLSNTPSTNRLFNFEGCLIAESAGASDTLPLWTFDHKLAIQHPSAQEVSSQF